MLKNVVLDFNLFKNEFDECSGVGKVPLAPSLGLCTIQTSSASAVDQTTSLAKKN